MPLDAADFTDPCTRRRDHVADWKYMRRHCRLQRMSPAAIQARYLHAIRWSSTIWDKMMESIRPHLDQHGDLKLRHMTYMTDIHYVMSTLEDACRTASVYSIYTHNHLPTGQIRIGRSPAKTIEPEPYPDLAARIHRSYELHDQVCFAASHALDELKVKVSAVLRETGLYTKRGFAEVDGEGVVEVIIDGQRWLFGRENIFDLHIISSPQYPVHSITI